MPKIIEFQPVGIKCDMPGCDWRDDTVVFDSKTYAREWLNRPCPECSGNLYTERDYALVKRMYRAAFWVNLLLGWLVWFAPKSRHKTEEATLHSDGRGRIVRAEVEPGGQWERVLRKAAKAKSHA